MAILDNIRACLDKKLLTLANAPDLVFENTTYEHTPGVTFIRAKLITNSVRPVSRGVNPWIKYDGIYALSIYTPEGEGTGAGLSLVDDLMDLFKATTYVVDGSTAITVDYTEAGTGFLDSPFYCTPVSVVWYTHNKQGS